ncbi:hypothetical protein HZB78_03600 [Candidatus Collierbacteria bacterium]|nr:hypothetical protein [Candidatus Collierbacteria bacterium]
MAFDQIKIKISNKRRFESVSTLVDRTDFEELVVFLRNKIGLTNKLIPYEHFDQFYKSLDYHLNSEELSEYNQMIDEMELLENRNQKTPEEAKTYSILRQEIRRWQNPKHNFLTRLDKYLSDHKIASGYKTVVIKAIVCGEIKENDFTLSVVSKGLRNIDRDRRWYWVNRRLSGAKRMGYMKIAKRHKEYLRTVENAIKTYASRLT